MIRGMVDTLDARLKSEGGDIESWLRLVRSRMVLGERDKAMVALDAVFVLRSQSGERTVAASDFFHGMFETAIAPGEPPPPGRFSITNDWPSLSARYCPASRAIMSVLPPGA